MRAAICFLLVLGGLVVSVALPVGADTTVNGCVIVSNPTNTHFTDCPGANLSGQNLIHDDFQYAAG